jgi:secondary thiamine-phosphate synthase enzyme
MPGAEMKIAQEVIDVATKGRGLYDITFDVQRVLTKSGVVTGLCTIFVRHTSASLVIQENADPAVLRDLERWMESIAPEDPKRYEHDAEGLDDMPGHLRAAVTRSSESVPVTGGHLSLGTWQAIYLFEHRRHAQRRHIVVHVAGLGG